MGKFIKIILIFIVAITLNASGLKHADSYEDAIEFGIKEKKYVVLFTHSPFCPWCRKMENETLSNQEVISLLNEKFIFVSVDLSVDVETEDVPKRFLPQARYTYNIYNKPKYSRETL
jgi:thioredoxin-related protein